MHYLKLRETFIWSLLKTLNTLFPCKAIAHSEKQDVFNGLSGRRKGEKKKKKLKKKNANKTKHSSVRFSFCWSLVFKLSSSPKSELSKQSIININSYICISVLSHFTCAAKTVKGVHTLNSLGRLIMPGEQSEETWT